MTGSPLVESPPRPHEVQLAMVLWIASVLVGAVTLVLSLSSVGSLVREELDAQVASNPELASLDRETIVRLASFTVVGASLLGLGLRLFLVVKLAAGRRWARTVLTVLGVLSVLGAVLDMRSASAAEAATAVVQSLLVASAIVCMFSEGAQPYFARVPRR